MNSESSFLTPPVFNGENYQAWAIRMTVHLEALDLWEAVEEDYEVTPLGNNPTINQIKIHKEKKTRKAKACLFSAVSPSILTRIMQMQSAAAIWEYLKKEYKGNERVQNMQVMNLIREFEMKKMKESETIKDYSDQLLDIANKVRLFATISSLENSKDLSSITLAELVKALQALEQRRIMRKESSVEGALQANSQNIDSNKGRKKNRKQRQSNNNNNQGGAHPPCPHCKKTNHPQQKCWWRPNVKCNKCGQLGHVERVCKSQPQYEEANAAANQHQEEQLFVATCFASNNSSESWLIDSGCTNHMTNDQELDRSVIGKVRIGNGELLDAEGRGTVAIESLTGLKLITDVLFVPDLDRNLLSVGHLLENGFKLLFEDKACLIKDADNKELFKIKMRGKSFSLNLLEEEQAAVVQLANNSELWHKRLGHFHHEAILFMKENHLVEGLPS
ncbi:uncharacterized protein LOC142166063 [Nicotiana tabacum]|uniref:Uncharacterized protein LOC142166063 n=1 Tax=Nicotiana tabacum TaxID=4097 RepID=A0AC58S6F7_TOBAC